MRLTIKTIIPGTILFLALCTACKESGQQATEDTNQETASMNEADDSKKFEGIQFATLTDTICGMPLKAGIADTLVHDGKIYGFCATECKQEFAKVLNEQQ